MTTPFFDMTNGGNAREYTAIFDELVRLAKVNCPEWTYFGDDDIGTSILSLLSYLADHLHFRASAVQRDMIPATSQRRNILVQLAHWLGYMPRRVQPATTDLVFSLPSAHTLAVEIPAGTRVSGRALDGSVATYETLAAGTIPAGSLSVTLPAAEGETQVLVSLGNTTGLAFQAFTFPINVVFNQTAGDLQVFIGDELAELVVIPAESDSQRLIYWCRENFDEGLDLFLGDGKFGKLPAAGLPITVTYRTSAGATGRCASNVLTSVLTPVLDTLGVAVNIRVTNPQPSAGGSNADSLEQIRTAAPAAFRAQQRCVTVEDYEARARTVPGVYQARVLISGLNGVCIYLVPPDPQAGVPVSEAVKRAVVAVFEGYKMGTDVVVPKAADVVPINVVLQVRALPNYRNVNVRRAVLDALVAAPTSTAEAGELDPSRQLLGNTIMLSDVIGRIEQVQGVDSLDVLQFQRRPSSYWGRNSGQASVSQITTTPTTTAQSWWLEFVSPTQFTVTGSVTGARDTVGTIGTVYEVPGEITFRVDAGTRPSRRFDRCEIRVGRPVWNIELSATEFPVVDMNTLSVTVSGGA